MEKFDKFKLGIALGAGSAALLGLLFYKIGTNKQIANGDVQEEFKFDEQGTRKILVCGSGMMVPGLVKYLMRHPKNRVTVASNIVKDAEDIANEFPGRCVHSSLDVNDFNSVTELVKSHDIVVSFIPPFLHQKVAKACIEARRHLVTASYISPEMMAFDEDAKKHDLLFLNECGLDPGIDIMTTMKVKDEVEKEGGKIKKYESWCGGLPAAEDCDNPLSYKFSWDPRAVFSTSKNSAKFLKDGEVVTIEGKNLMTEGTTAKNFVKSLNLEGYPNRDSTSFLDTFGFKDCESFVRGTIRYGRFGIVMLGLHQIGITDNETKINHDKIKSVRDLAEWLVEGIPDQSKFYEDALKAANITDEKDKDLVSKLLSKITDAVNFVEIINSWKYFELLNPNKKIDSNAKTPLDALSSISLEKMSYRDGERDLVVMRHIFEIETKDKKKEILHSTMVATGDPVGSGGFSIMSKTVGYTAAIATNLILDGKFKTRGVVGPKDREIYTPILAELDKDNIRVIEEYQ